MADQQLIDYIKKARIAGQAEDQTRNLLYKNGWTVDEVNDAIASLSQPNPQPQPQPQAVSQPKIEAQPQVSQIANQPNAQPQTRAPQQTYQPQSSSMASQDNMPHVKKSHMTLKLLIVLIILFVLGGVGYFVAGQYINIPWSPFAPNPQTVINKMMINMKDVKSSHTISQEEISVVGQGKLLISADSKNDATDANNPKVDGTASINLVLPQTPASSESANVSLITIDGVSYFKVNEIVDEMGLLASQINVSQIQEQWFKFDQDSVKALSQAQAEEISIPQGNNSKLAKDIQNLLLAKDLISFDKKLKDQIVSGQSTYHYSAKITKDKLKGLLTKIIDLSVKASEDAQAVKTSGSSISLIQGIISGFMDSFVSTVGDINMELWIGKKDFMLYQVKVDKSIDLNDMLPGVNTQVGIKFNITNSDFNKPMKIEAPEGAQKIEDIVLPLLKVKKIESDMRQIESIAQLVFLKNKSYSSLCKAGLLNGYLSVYGQELVDLNNDIVGQGAKKPLCLSGIQNYCISTQLSDGSYLCIDKNGNLGDIKCVSYNTVCKFTGIE